VGDCGGKGAAGGMFFHVESPDMMRLLIAWLRLILAFFIIKEP
jgi:hypothetical protein